MDSEDIFMMSFSEAADGADEATPAPLHAPAVHAPAPQIHLSAWQPRKVTVDPLEQSFLTTQPTAFMGGILGVPRR